MFSLVFVCVLAAASAAPRYSHHHHGGFDLGSSEEYHHRQAFRRRPSYPGFGENYFEAKTFWDNLETEMKQLDDMMKEFSQYFPSSISREGVEGDQYKIVIPLTGYKEEEITVKARAGLLMVQAVQKTAEGNQRSYQDLRTLPACIDLSGTWSYDDDVLTIQFPVKKDDEDKPVTEVTQTELPKTEAPDHSREEMGHDDNDDDLDVDIGNRGDNDKKKELETNEIPRNTIEATTYAVDLKDEVEFVTVSY